MIVSWAANKPFAYPFNTRNMYVWEIVSIGGGGLFLSLQPSKERLKGSYLGNVLSKSAPGGLVCVFAVCVYFLINYINPQFLSYDVARTLSVITFTALSFCVLFRVCVPFDTYRTSVFSAMLFFAALFFFLDIYFTNIVSLKSWRELFGIDYTDIGLWPLVTALSVFVSSTGAYFLMDWGSRHIASRMGANAEAGGQQHEN
jgi:hypothetical protein